MRSFLSNSYNWRKAGRLLLLLLTVSNTLVITGCWDSLEIENRALILGMAIDEPPPEEDRTKDEVTYEVEEKPMKERYMITAQIAVPGRVPLGPSSPGGGNEMKDSIWVVKVTGISLDDALNNLQQQIADPKYLIHLRVIVISEAIAKRGLADLNDYLRRNAEVRRRTWMLVSEGEAAKIMTLAPPLERIPTLYLLNMLEKAVSYGKFPLDYLGVFWSNDSKWGQDGYLPYITPRGDDNVMIKGLAYFSNGVMVGKTNPIGIGAFMAAKGLSIGGYSIMTEAPGIGHVMVQTKERSSRIAVRIVDGLPAAKFSIHLEGTITEHLEEPVDIHTSRQISIIQENYNRHARGIVQKLIRDTQKQHSDIFGLGEMVRAKYPSYWKEHVHSKRDWERIYADIPVEVELRMNIRQIGLKN